MRAAGGPWQGETFSWATRRTKQHFNGKKNVLLHITIFQDQAEELTMLIHLAQQYSGQNQSCQKSITQHSISKKRDTGSRGINHSSRES